MASKFFTWTKGDRKNAVELLTAGGVIPIPVECISIKGMDVRKTPKLEMMPFAPDGEMKSPVATAASYDAAIESATSLVTLLSGLLKAPQLSAHMAQINPTLQTPTTRPRSRTAPSTPRFEMGAMDPVELLGSVPPTPLRMQNSEYPTPAEAVSPAVHPPSVTCGTKSYPDLNRCLPSLQIPPVLPKTRDSSDSGTYTTRSATTLPAISPLVVSPLRPVMSAIQPAPGARPSFSARQSSQDQNDSAAVQQKDAESVLLSQISSMRISHDAHTRSLKQAHETEVSSHLAYISFLEKRQLERTMTSALDASNVSHSRAIQEPSELPVAPLGASPQMDSELCRKEAEQQVSEVESLRRNLSLIRKEQAEAGDLKEQRDQMRDTLEQRDERILQLKRSMQHAKDKEKTDRNTIEELKWQLIAANNQRLDALEGFHAAYSTLELSKQRKDQAALCRSLPRTLTQGNISAASSKSLHSLDTSCSGTDFRMTTPEAVRYPHDDDAAGQTMSRLDVIEKDESARVLALKKQLETLGKLKAQQGTEFDALKAQFEVVRTALAKAENERDRLQLLLQSELRRQARRVATSIVPSPSVTAEASRRVHDIVQSLESAAGTMTATELVSPGPRPVSDALEKELEHCIRELILYKLDVRGYRKDLKEARAQIESLQIAAIKRPATPPSTGKEMRARSARSSDASQYAVDSNGLGICMSDTPLTPPKMPPVSTSSALSGSPAPSADTDPITPQHRPKTPLAVHKRLPRPPPQSTSPVMRTDFASTVFRICEVNTARSISDPIISTQTQLNSAGNAQL